MWMDFIRFFNLDELCSIPLLSRLASASFYALPPILENHLKRRLSNTTKQKCLRNVGSDIYKKKMKEWKILPHNRIDSIYVRIYEHCIDLLRAVIIGAIGRPYHKTLFVFNITFSPHYLAMSLLVHSAPTTSGLTTTFTTLVASAEKKTV
ncbi:hypothetical protein Fmac_005989 [Flemingia macrophylla]|uniref:UBC core domain-containing protein n=1 Tax=Flemingia macrophylla TaxID=520843 RepID=A0ABD1N9D6_9FABA